MSIESLLTEARKCEICKKHLELGPRPVLEASSNSKILIIGQAPGTKVHASGIPWDDQSGKRLREWMQISKEDFYNPDIVAIVPMGFCYPGKGKSGDLPPRPECAPKWHQPILSNLKNVELTLLIGKYAQDYYLPQAKEFNLTEKVRRFENFLPNYFVLPHPSPRNQFWIRKNPWFEELLIPILQSRLKKILV